MSKNIRKKRSDAKIGPIDEKIIGDNTKKFLKPNENATAVIWTDDNDEERIINVKLPIKMEELGLDENKDWNKYYEIEKEEEERFDNRFKK